MTWTRRDGLALALLALAPWLFYWPLFAPGGARHYLAEGDFIDQFHAFASFEVAELAAGRVPLWNPYAYSGTPFWADVQSAVAYPPSLAVSLFSALALGRLPLLALEIEAVGHLALAGILTYAFARTVLRRRGAALVAALGFSLGGYLTGYPVLQLAVLETAVWLPLSLLGAHRLAAAPRSGPWLSGVLLTAAGLAMAVLAGHPQTALYVLYATAAYFAWRARPWSRADGGRYARFAASVGLAAGLSAAGWLPAWQYLRLSNRAAMDYAALAHGFPSRELLGAVLGGVTLWSPLYVSVVGVLLAAAAIRRALAPRPAGQSVAFWLVLGVSALVLSLGSGAFAYDLAYLLAPGFDLFRGQERAAVLVSFSLSMLAGHGVLAWDADRRGTARAVAAGALILLVIGAGLAVVAPGDARAAAVRLAAAAAAAGATALALGRDPRRAPLLLAAVAALVAVDLYAVGGRANLQGGPPGELSPPPVVLALAEASGRVQNEDRLPRNFGVLHGIESTYGASPLRLRTYETLYETLRATNEPRLRALLAVTHVLTDRPVPEDAAATTSVPAGDVGTIHELPDRPYVWPVARAESAPDDRAALARLADPGFDPYAQVVLAGSRAPGPEADAPAAARPSARLLARGIGRVAVEKDGGAGWLVFSEVFYPGWRATVEGAPAPVLRANVALIAVPVPDGPVTVHLAFEAPRVATGLAASIATAVVLAVGAALAVRREKAS